MYDLLVGEHIVLRKAKENDYEEMLKVWSDEEVYKWMLFTPTKTIPEAIERNKRSIKHQREHYAYYVALKDSDIPIGLCAINEYEPHRFEECGICIGSKYFGKGYGKEIVSLLLDLAFNKLNAKDFDYAYFKENLRSENIAKKFGFEYYKSNEMIRPWDNKRFIIIHTLLKKEKYEMR